MEKKCYKCGSAKVAKVVSGNLAYIPEIRKDLIEGRAVLGCACGGAGTTGVYRCLDCGFEWDYYYEKAMEEKE